MSKLDEMLRAKQPPGFLRPSSGPGSCENEIVGPRPDVRKEVRLTLKRAEELGKMHDPAFRHRANYLMKKINSEPPQELWDYETDGHPSLGDLG